MEKPVRIVGNEKIHSFNERVRNGLEHALNFMLATNDATKITFSAFQPFLMPLETYLSVYRKKSVMVKIHSEKAFKGELYWFFEMMSAVVLGGMLRMLPGSAMIEKVQKGEFDSFDQDAFGELGNQLCGILDRAFRVLTRKDIHLKMDFNRMIYPEENMTLDSFVNDEEYVVLLTEVSIPDYGKQKLTLLLPRSLYEMLLNIEFELEGISPKILLVYSWNADRVEQLQTALNSRYTKVLKIDNLGEVLDKVAAMAVSAIGLDLAPLTFPLSHIDTVMFKRLTTNRAFMQVPHFLTWDKATDDGIAEIRKLGLVGATKESLSTEFPKWAGAFTVDPGKKA